MDIGAKVTRRALLRVLAAAGALVGLAIAGACGLRDLLDSANRGAPQPSMGGGMMGSATRTDMTTYMELFNRHTEIRRSVEEVPGGIRTVTESDAPELVTKLQAHVSSMYAHVNQGAEVTCMSKSLPTLFRNGKGYRRELTLTARGVAVTETSSDPRLTAAIREHAQEVSGFVRDGMPAMMQGMMGR